MADDLSTSAVEVALARLGLLLPPAPKPVASYVPVRRAGNLLFVSGQLPMRDGVLMAAGAVPSVVSVEVAREAARQCVLNGLAAVKADIGDLSLVRDVIRVGVFVQSDSEFDGQPEVANGASDLLVALFGESGRHSRAAVGVNALPRNAAVEIEFVFSL